MHKKFLEWRRLFRRLSKNCGVLRLDGRELNINDVQEGEFVLQDAYGREQPIRIQRDDSRISELSLQSEFR